MLMIKFNDNLYHNDIIIMIIIMIVEMIIYNNITLLAVNYLMLKVIIHTL